MTDEMEDLDLPATRRDLRDLERATRRDLRDLGTELRTELRAEWRTDLAAALTAQTQEIGNIIVQHMVAADAAMRVYVDQTVSRHVAQHITASTEAMRAEFRGVEDRYRDLPDRVTKLEAVVFPKP